MWFANDALDSPMFFYQPGNLSSYGVWNPLTDDGDALRLAVKLGIHLQFAMDYAVAYAGSVHAKQFTERCGSDQYAATRRAIVRAAAEIGRALP